MCESEREWGLCARVNHPVARGSPWEFVRVRKRERVGPVCKGLSSCCAGVILRVCVCERKSGACVSGRIILFRGVILSVCV